MSGGAGQPPRTSRAYRALGPGAEPGGDALSTAITSGETFFATVRRYAAIHGVDAEHVCTALRLGGVPGAPVTARLVWGCAAALAAGGYTVAPPANDVTDNFRRVPPVARMYSCGTR